MILSAAPIRGQDNHGSGAWGAPRGNRVHKGVDYAMCPGSILLSPLSGVVGRLGYAYADDLSYRIIDISEGPYRARFFYIQPSVAEGQVVRKGDPIGTVQDLRTRYEGITTHTHIELWRGDQCLNPDLEMAKIG